VNAGPEETIRNPQRRRTVPSLTQQAAMPKETPPPSAAHLEQVKADWRAERIRLGLSLNPVGPTIILGPVAAVAFARDQQREDDAKRAEALETLTIIVNEYGPERVGVWVQNIGKLRGAK
jgi:hypothetical protein